MRNALNLLLILFFFLPGVCRADSFRDLTDHLERAEKTRTVSASFTQVRHLRDLDMDIRITGSMLCDFSGHLRWQIDTPIRSVTIIDDRQLIHFDSSTGKKMKVSARDFPWMPLLKECFSDWLSADIRKLSAEKKFILSSPAPKTLRLVPCGAPFHEFMRSADISFNQDFSAVASVLITETSGDTVKIDFSNVRKNFSVPADAWDLPEK